MAKAKNEAKIKFLAETQEFRDNVKGASATMAELSSELKLNAAQMKTNGESAEKLAERKELLESQLEQASQKTENLSAQMEACTRNYGENSDEARKLAIQINNAKAAEERIQQEINGVTDKLDEQAAASIDTRNALEKLEDTISEQESALSDLKREYADAAVEYGTNSREAKDLAKQLTELSSELNDNRGKMAKAERAADNLAGEVDDAGDAARDASDGFTVWKGTLADLASSGIQGVMSGIGNLASTFWNLGDETRELRTNLGKVEVAFEDTGLSADNAANTYEEFYGILGDEGQATEAVSHLAKIADSEEDLAEWTRICTGLYGSFGDSLPIEGLTEAANETIKTGTVTGTLADALNWSTMSSEEWQKAFTGHPKALKKFQRALKSGMTAEEAFNEALTKCTTESEREQVIRQALTGLYGEAADAYTETNGAIIEANKAQANYNNALGGLGEIIEPIKTSFMNGMAGMLESVTEFISGFDTAAIQAMIQDAFTYINETVFPAIKAGIDWFIDNKDLVIGGLTAIVAGIAAFKVVSIIQTAVGAFKAFQAATTGLTIAQKLLNLVMSMNPIGLVIAAVIGLVAGFIYLWNNCEAFREFWIGLWEGIKYYAGIAIDWLVNLFTVTIPEAWESFKAYASELWNSIWTTVSTAAMNIWTDVTTWFGNMWTSVTETVSGIWTDVTTWFTNIWNSLTGTVQEIWTSVTTKFSEIKTSLFDTVSGIWSDVTSKFAEIKGNVTQSAQELWSSVTAKFSSLWTSIIGIWNGIKTSITGAWDKIKSSVSSAIGNVRDTISRVFYGVKSTVSSIWSGIKGTISDVWDNIKSSVTSKINSVRDKISNVFYGVKSTVTSVWNGIKSAIEDPINTAKKTVEDVVDKIKNAFDFEWSLPKIKLPHFSVSGGKAPWGFMGEGSLPSVSVDWYAKGAVLKSPTIFGMDKQGNLMGGGEAGAEAVAPIDVLLGYVRTAVAEVMDAMTFNLDSVAPSHVDNLETYVNSSGDLGGLIDAIAALANRPINLDIDGVRFATATAGASDNVSGNRLNLRNRGLAVR